MKGGLDHTNPLTLQVKWPKVVNYLAQHDRELVVLMHILLAVFTEPSS